MSNRMYLIDGVLDYWQVVFGYLLVLDVTWQVYHVYDGVSFDELLLVELICLMHDHLQGLFLYVIFCVEMS